MDQHGPAADVFLYHHFHRTADRRNRSQMDISFPDDSDNDGGRSVHPLPLLFGEKLCLCESGDPHSDSTSALSFRWTDPHRSSSEIFAEHLIVQSCIRPYPSDAGDHVLIPPNAGKHYKSKEKFLVLL